MAWVQTFGVSFSFFDSYGLFRASHSHNPPTIRTLVELSLHFVLMLGHAIKSFTHCHACMAWVQTFGVMNHIFLYSFGGAVVKCFLSVYF